MPPHFTTLPREIRDMILDLCLVVGTITPYPANNEHRDPFKNAASRPVVSLFLVNKMVSAEAVENFYGKNIWVISWSWGHEHLLARDAQIPTDKIWHVHRERIRHVSLSFDLQDLPPSALVVAAKTAYMLTPEDSSACFRRKLTHDVCVSVLENICRWKIIICQHINVRSVTINIENLFCKDGCCRMNAVRSCCFDPLLYWARRIEEARMKEDILALPGDWYPEITLVGFLSIAEMTTARRIWEGQWGPLNHSMSGDEICLKGFFLLTEAKPVE
ncbi:MAG: hypothetical protein ASARMPRED_003542 [Alectoria sarmentosa]|nr:MAG: hypothetical protein ASARMPRED_003542 [Alectoria sarmentosa]